MVDVSGTFSGLIRNNGTAAFIVDCLKSETTEEAVTSKMLEEYDASEEVIRKAVHDVIEKLRKVGAIDE